MYYLFLLQLLVVTGEASRLLVDRNLAVCVKNEGDLRKAITSASSYNGPTTIITLCGDIKMAGPTLTTFNLTNKNIELRCGRAVSSRCVIDAQNVGARIFHGNKTNLIATRVNFMNAGELEPRSFLTGGALFFNSSKVYLRECSFSNNMAYRGGAIHMEGPDSVLILKGGTKTSPMKFSRNFAHHGGAVSMRNAQVFSIRQSNTIFENNEASENRYEDDTSGGAISLANIRTVDMTNVVFTNNAVYNEDFSGTVREVTHLYIYHYLGVTTSSFLMISC